jgi:hypothetical protein
MKIVGCDLHMHYQQIACCIGRRASWWRGDRSTRAQRDSAHERRQDYPIYLRCWMRCRSRRSTSKDSAIHLRAVKMEWGRIVLDW